MAPHAPHTSFLNDLECNNIQSVSFELPRGYTGAIDNDQRYGPIRNAFQKNISNDEIQKRAHFPNCSPFQN